MKIVIIGAGIAGLSSFFKLKENGISSEIFESGSTYGGLLDNIKLNGFRFDRAIHLSFADKPKVGKIFNQTPLLKIIFWNN